MTIAQPTSTSVSVPGRTLAVPNLIFDVGLNIGQDSEFYLAEGYRVLAIEADPVLAEAARKKFSKEVEEGRLEILNVGIADRDGVADFWICQEKPEFNSFYRTIAARDSYSHKCIQIRVIRFSRIIEQYGVPYYLKIDIEGNDMLCLEGLSSSCLPKYLSVESECPLDEESATVADGLRILEKLYDLGYREFKLIDQHTFCALSLPAAPHYKVDTLVRKTLNRPPIKHVMGMGLIFRTCLTRRKLERRFRREFPMGSSGAWGEETPGTWISFEEAKVAYIHYRKKHFLAADTKFHSFWCDWHAKQ